MRKVHLVLTKEGLRRDLRSSASAIVLDIIFATSSITAALESGARRVFAALDLEDARQISTGLVPDSWILAGEKNAESFEGYCSYEPLALATRNMAGKDLIYATTNGTVALRRADFFKHVYAASLRNGPAVVRHALANSDDTSDIVIVCSGSKGRFSLEDFYGAGYIVRCLREISKQNLQYGDAAMAAELAFQHTSPYDVLAGARLGQLMLERGLEENIQYISRLDCSDVVGRYHEGCVVDVSTQKGTK